MLQPLSLKSTLAATPTKNPKYAVSHKLSDGSEVSFADPVATRAMVAMMDMNAVIGGAASHYGGPAAFAELMSATHGIMFHESKKLGKSWDQLFNFVNDAGHCENGIYALKANYEFGGLSINDLKKFRSIDSFLTGHGEAHLYPQGVLMSNGPLGSGFPQSQGLAMADCLAGNSRTTLTAISDGGLMEGEAKEALAAIPGFAQAGKLAPYVLMISDNNTKLSGRIDKESFSMQPTFSSLTALGWEVLQLQNGNDLAACIKTLEQALATARSNPKKPVAILAKTVKGIGTKKTAESASGGHGFPCKSATEVPEFVTEIYSGAEIPTEFQAWFKELVEIENQMKAKAIKPSHPEEKIQVGISSAMIKARKAGLPVVSITSDLPGSTGVAGFRKEFPQESLDVGIAESNMMSTAAGFSRLGFIPVVDTFAQFGVTKGALPLTMASLSLAPMICVFSHTGFQDAADGASHQALSYLSMIGNIPDVEVYALTCSEEADVLMTATIEKFAAERSAGRVPKSTVFFLGRENFPKNFGNSSHQLNQAQVIQETAGKNSVAIVAAGSMLGEGLKAAAELAGRGIGSIVVNPVCLNKLDIKTFKAVLAKTAGRVITVEDHQLNGGFSAYFAQAMSLAEVPFSLISLGVHGEFGQSAYNAIELYQKHNIDSGAIVRNILKKWG